jgi:alpha-ribazole phosphatase
MAAKYAIYLIRHGETEGSKRKIPYGSGTDLPLLAEGVAALERLKAAGTYPTGDGAVLISSGMTRTDETLRVLFGDREFDVIPELKEVNLGAFEMKLPIGWNSDEAHNEWLRDEQCGIRPPGGESFLDMRDRVLRGMGIFFERYKGNVTGDWSPDYIIVSHHGPICAMMQCFFPGMRRTLFSWAPEPGHGYQVMMEGMNAIDYRDF